MSTKHVRLTSNPHWFENLLESRIQVAREVAEELQSSSVVAIAVAGSVALKRATHNSDLDMVIIRRDSKPDVQIETQIRNGIFVEISNISIFHCRNLICGYEKSVKELREAARIANSVVLYDPQNFFPKFKAYSDELLPLQDETVGRLKLVNNNLLEFSRQPTNTDDLIKYWEKARSCLDNLILVRLSLSRNRYHKAKWVIHDLYELTETRILECLKICYSLYQAEKYVDESIDSTRKVISHMTEKAKAPSYSEHISLRFIREHPRHSYICRTLEDAEDLLKSNMPSHALYVSRYASRIAVTEFIGTTENLDQGHFNNDINQFKTHYLKASYSNSMPPSYSCLQKALTSISEILTNVTSIYRHQLTKNREHEEC